VYSLKRKQTDLVSLETYQSFTKALMNCSSSFPFRLNAANRNIILPPFSEQTLQGEFCKAEELSKQVDFKA